jgi:23S rRNA G2069 N7-methylase RlmK/C1962 C5-methylase RlmI
MSSSTENKIQAQAEMLGNRLQKRFKHLSKWAKRCNIEAFRLYDRDIPEIPLLLDFYGNVTTPHNAAITAALYKRPYEKDEDDEEQWLSVMKESIADVLKIKPDNIFMKLRENKRPRQSRLEQKFSKQYEKIPGQQFTKIIKENNLKFKVNFTDYIDSGLFLDRRLLRAIVREESAGKKVLNLFSYTGSFSVFAAAGGAAATDSVDMSNTYQNWAQDNFSINGFKSTIIHQKDYKQSQCEHRLICADALKFIEQAAKAALKWDIIILDPPAFSNSKKMMRGDRAVNFDLRRDHTMLITQCLKLLVPGGKLFLSCNTRNFKPKADELKEQLMHLKDAKLHAKDLTIVDLTNKLIDEDFKGRKIPATFMINF